MTKNVYILRGLPGSGKSTLAKQIKESVCSASFESCSADDYFTFNPEKEYRFDPSKLGVAHQYCRNLFSRAISNGVQHIVVDNTNIKLEHWEYYKDLAEQSGYNLYVYTVGRFDEQSIEQYYRRGTHNVPLETIKRMATQFQL